MSNAEDYSTIFRHYVIRSLKYILAKIQQSGDPLLPYDRNQILHVLSYALKLSEAWSTSRTLLFALAPKMEQEGYRDEWIAYLEQGLNLSRAMGDNEAIAELHFQLGILSELRGKYEEAHTHFANSAVLSASLDVPTIQARALNRQAYVARRQRKFAEARRLINKALELLSEQEAERAYSYLVLGAIALDKQDWLEAVKFFQQSLNLWQLVSDQRMMAWSLTNLGAALRPLTKYQEAIQSYQQAIELLRSINDPINQAVAQMNLGNVYLDLGEPDQALILYELAERSFRQVQDQLRLVKVYNNIGLAYHKKQEWAKAEYAFAQSIAQGEKIGNIPSLVNGLDGLGQLYLEQSEVAKAIATFKKALTYLDQIEGDPLYDKLLKVLTKSLSDATAKGVAARIDYPAG